MITSKFKSLVHMIIEDCDPARLGATRLNKILWFVDVEAFRRLSNPVTNETYVRRKNGPVPASILATLRELEDEGAITIDEPTIMYQPRMYTSKITADRSMISQAEKDLIEEVRAAVLTLTADEVSEISHDEVWSAAKDGESIPLSATLVAEPGDYRAEVKTWAAGIIEVLSANLHSDGDTIGA